MTCNKCNAKGFPIPKDKKCPKCHREHGKTTVLRMEPKDYIPFPK